MIPRPAHVGCRQCVLACRGKDRMDIESDQKPLEVLRKVHVESRTEVLRLTTGRTLPATAWCRRCWRRQGYIYFQYTRSHANELKALLVLPHYIALAHGSEWLASCHQPLVRSQPHLLQPNPTSHHTRKDTTTNTSTSTTRTTLTWSFFSKTMASHEHHEKVVCVRRR